MTPTAALRRERWCDGAGGCDSDPLTPLASLVSPIASSNEPDAIGASGWRYDRWSRSSTPSPSSGAGVGCRAATTVRSPAPGPGCTSPRSAISPGAPPSDPVLIRLNSPIAAEGECLASLSSSTVHRCHAGLRSPAAASCCIRAAWPRGERGSSVWASDIGSAASARWAGMAACDMDLSPPSPRAPAIGDPPPRRLLRRHRTHSPSTWSTVKQTWSELDSCITRATPRRPPS